MTDFRQRIAALSPERRALLAARLGASSLPFPHADRAAAHPLTLGQARLWATQHAAPGVPVDVVCQIIGIQGPLDRGVLGTALDALVQRHEAFRTTFHDAGDRIVQRVHAAGPPLLDPAQLTELTGVAAAQREAQLHAAARELAWQPFDFASGPLVRARLVKLAEGEHALVFVAHNLCFDAWSFTVFLDELDQRYAALRAGEQPQSGPPAHQFLDFAAWQERFLESVEGQRKLAAWREALRGAPSRILELDPGRLDAALPSSPEASPFAGERIDFSLPIELRERLAEVGKRAGATLFMTLMAVVTAALAVPRGQGDVVIGTLNANRGRREIENALGFFLNVVPIRTRLGDAPTFSSLLKQVRAAALDAQGRADIPYEAIVRAARPDAPDAPLFDVLFIFENITGRSTSHSDLRFSTQDVDKRTARFDLTVSVYDEPGAFHGWVEYARSRISPERAAAIAQAFQRVAMELAENPEASLQALRGARA